MRRLLSTLPALLALALPVAAHAQGQPELGAADCKPQAVTPTRVHRHGPLTADEMAMARRAWRYFENNTQPTGLANAVDQYPSTTMWDTASYLGAVVSARELGIIDGPAADARIGKLLTALQSISFFRGELPNKVYHTATLEKSDYANKPGEIGYSALDLGRLLVWLRIVRERYPQHAEAADRFVARWKFDQVVDPSGMMFGAAIGPDGKTQYLQEGRLGYEEYAAKGFQLWGKATVLASRAEPYATTPIACVEVPYDSRDPRKYQQHNYVVSESYVLDGIELGWSQPLGREPGRPAFEAEFAQRIYQAQENRWRATGILTARSEHQLEAEPYFVYDTIFTDGYAWNTITDTGRYVPQYAAVSLKAALGLWVLWPTEYTDVLFRTIAGAYDERRGFHEALLENGKGPIRAYTANNNGIMLETLLFKATGVLVRDMPCRRDKAAAC
jgi:hypothetical protein